MDFCAALVVLDARAQCYHSIFNTKSGKKAALKRRVSMWVLRGTFLGMSIFGIDAVVFMLAFFRSMGPLLAGPGQQSSIDIRSISLLTVGNPWFWATFAACLVIGLAIARSWPGKFSPVFWVMLAVIDLVPAGLLSLFLVLVFKLKQVAATVAK